MELWWVNMQGKAIDAFRRKIYNSKRWRATRHFVLDNTPFCAMCEEQGRTTAATDVDHINNLTNIFLSGEHDEAYNIDNLQALCKQCHGEKTRKEHKK